jgi:hypothetical protein
MLALMLLKWLQQHSRPAVVMPLVYGALSLQVTVHRKKKLEKNNFTQKQVCMRILKFLSTCYGLEKKLEKNNFTQKQVYARILKFLSTCYGCGAKVLSTKQVYMCKFMVPFIYNLGTSDTYLSNSWG